MKMTVQLEKQLPKLVGKNVNVKEMVVGKVTDYDKETGLATVEIDDDSYSKIGWNQGWMHRERYHEIEHPKRMDYEEINFYHFKNG